MIQRKKRVNSRKPGKPRRRAGACRPYLDWLLTQPCRITGWLNSVDHTFVDPAHLRVKRLGGDLYNAISLSHNLHQEWHQIGRHSWCEKHSQTWEGLLETARQQTEEFLTEHPEFREAA